MTVYCQLTVGANSLSTINGGGLTVTGAAGKLIMTSPAAFVDVAGLAQFEAGSTTGTLTAGTLSLRGGMTTLLLHDFSDVYAPSGSHKTVFVGTAAQTVNMCIPCSNGSMFNNVEFQSSSDVSFTNAATFNGSFIARSSSKVTAGASAILTVSGDVTTETGSLLSGVAEMTLSGGTRFPHFGGVSTPAKLNVNASLPMDQNAVLTGDLVVNNTLTVGAFALSVGGNLSTQTSSGRLTMTSAGGYVLVGGSATFAGASEDTFLTNGTLEVRGDFSQSNTFSANSFRTTGSHLTILSGTGAQSIFFTSTAGSSQFNDLSIQNISASGVTFTSIGNAGRDLNIGVTSGATTKVTFNQTFNVGRDVNAKAGAKLIQSGAGKRMIVSGAIVGNATADLGGVDSVRVVGTTFPIYNNTTAGKAPRVTHLTNTSLMTVAANGTIAGGLTIQGPLNLNGKSLIVKDSLLIGTSGSIDMSNTSGTLTLGGNFAEVGGTFAPPASSLVTLNGTSLQQVSFNNSTNNFFGNLDITNTGSGVQLATNVSVNGDLRVRAGAKLSVPAARTLAVDPAKTLFLHNNSTIDVVGTVSFSSCQKGTAVIMTGAGSSGLSTGCTSSGSLP
jgi:hypothetical protein